MPPKRKVDSVRPWLPGRGLEAPGKEPGSDPIEAARDGEVVQLASVQEEEVGEELRVAADEAELAPGSSRGCTPLRCGRLR